MADFLVTIKLPKNPSHDPRNKVAGECPISGMYCSDVTGEHHTVIYRDIPSIEKMREMMKEHHITRIEAL